MPLKEANVYTVSELTREIRFLLEDNFSDVWVEGEISNYTVSSAGHAYFSLKDKDGLLNCVMFKGSAMKVKFEVDSGLSIVCRGKISLYDKRGQYQLYVSHMEPKGKGALQLAFEQLKEKLKKEGLFDEENKKDLPQVPKRVGVVTSPTGAAIRDILKVAHRRFDNLRVTISPVRVQGTESQHEIAKAIEEFNEFNRYLEETGAEEDPIDLLIVGRGGGSLEDLWPFNEEKVARSIFASEIPVISAVGHEVDFTIADFVADRRAATPTEAAEKGIPLKEDLLDEVASSRESLFRAIKNKLEYLHQEVKRLKESYVLRSPMNVFLQLEQQIDDLLHKASRALKHLIEVKRGKFISFAAKLDTLSPLAVLSRGYSITFKGDEVIKDTQNLKKGDSIVTKLAEGEAVSTIEEIR